MPKLKLTYFDFHGGRGEPARLRSLDRQTPGVSQLGRVLINRQAIADFGAPPNVRYWG
jgi:hypothetical protein